MSKTSAGLAQASELVAPSEISEYNPEDHISDWKKRLSPEEQMAFVCKVMSMNDGFQDPWAGMFEHLDWRTDNEYAPITIWVRCNDLFYWACADSEELTPENLAELKKAVDDVALALNAVDPRSLPRGEEFNHEEWSKAYDLWKKVGVSASDLFCCRMRKMRPQTPYYDERYMPEVLKPLFDACGPSRESGDEDWWTDKAYDPDKANKE